MTLSVVIVSSVDPVLRDTAAAALSCDLPGAAVLTYSPAPGPDALVRVRSMSRDTPTVERIEVRGCLTCATRDDLRQELVALADADVGQVVAVLPVTMDPVPICFDLQRAESPATVATSMAVVDASSLADDLLGADLLDERGLSFGEHDRRAVGEAVARQLESADLLAFVGGLDAHATALLDHVVGPVPDRADLYAMSGEAVLARRRPPALSLRGDLRSAAGTGAANAHGVWTLDLQSWKPFHPQRLYERLERLGCGRLRGRGYFWLPTRPETRCAWDGAGGQLSIGELDRWDGPARTRLVITAAEGDRRAVRRAFEASLLTDAELAAGLAHWCGQDDGFDQWLGPHDEHLRTGIDLLADED